jgi:DNA topoisomerase-1
MAGGASNGNGRRRSGGASRRTTSATVATALDVLDAEAAAEEAGLRYVTDAEPGISRRRSGTGFSYRGSDGSLVSPRTRRRVESLAIPPAWTDVWICTRPNGHLQATGRDARGRKQYRYHPRWRTVRDEAKFEQLAAFGNGLADLRAAVDADLDGPCGPEQVVAAVVRLLDDTLVRVGNEQYAEANDSYGLTTLRPEHLEDAGRAGFSLRFVGKSGVEHDVTVRDPKLARLVRRCRELDGQVLFSYRDTDGELRSVSSSDVNEYLHRHVGPEITAKDFRTWGASSLATRELGPVDPPGTERDTEAVVLAAIDAVAEQLGNTRAVCRQSYIHPTVIDAFREGALHEVWSASRRAGRLDRADRSLLELLATDGRGAAS